MIYLISQEWGNTKGNHAGMSHLSRLLSKDQEVAHICIPFIPYRGTRPLYDLMYLLVGVYLLFKLNREDSIILMEYLNPTRNQRITARIIRLFRKNKINALIHLVPSDMDKFYPTKHSLESWISKVDSIITFGSSLTSYLRNRDVKNNIITTFHYVDSNYYQASKRENNRLKAIFMGNMKRDIDSLKYIIEKCPEVDFIYCKGHSTRDNSDIESYPNVKIYGFLEESELRGLMNQSDLSLNLMYDTIGSNVITTSMAMGLVMLVSDVGSIRDYCNDENSFFCKSNDDFVEAILKCNDNRSMVLKKQEQSVILSKRFTPTHFLNDAIK